MQTIDNGIFFSYDHHFIREGGVEIQRPQTCVRILGGRVPIFLLSFNLFFSLRDRLDFPPFEIRPRKDSCRSLWE